jgi:hypothetical protein
MELDKAKIAFVLYRKIFMKMWIAFLQQAELSYLMKCLSF